MPAAVGDRPGEQNLYVPTTTTGWLESASSLSESFRDEHLQVFPVPVVTLDDSVPGPIDVLKIDVESYESRVLSGAPDLKDDRPLIFLEFVPPTPSARGDPTGERLRGRRPHARWDRAGGMRRDGAGLHGPRRVRRNGGDGLMTS